MVSWVFYRVTFEKAFERMFTRNSYTYVELSIVCPSKRGSQIYRVTGGGGGAAVEEEEVRTNVDRR